MKLQTQFTVPKKELRGHDYFKNLFLSKKILKQDCKDYLSKKDFLVFCN